MNPLILQSLSSIQAVTLTFNDAVDPSFSLCFLIEYHVSLRNLPDYQSKIWKEIHNDLPSLAEKYLCVPG